MLQNNPVHRLLAAFFLCGTLVTAVPARGATILDWSLLAWNDGDLANTYTLADGTVVIITVATAASGTFSPALFGVNAPYKDGTGGSATNFGTLLDLGVLFDPAPNQGTSPVIITLTLSPARKGVAFEISDIDFSVQRIDQVVIACDGAAPSSLTAKTATPSFSITGGNTATSNGSTSVPPGSDDGTVLVGCGTGAVSTVTITYNEASAAVDPTGRGIGVFGGFQFDTPQADLSITKTDGVTNAIPGQPVTYTLQASNAGPSAAPGSTVADTFPAACTSVHWTCTGAGGGTCTASGSGNLNDTVNLPVGGSVTYTAICAVSASATGSLANTATVAPLPAIQDPAPGNNSATDTDTLNAVPAGATVSGTKTVAGTTFRAGSTVTYTVVLTNSGGSAQADNPGDEFTDVLPAQLALVSATATGGTAVATTATNTVTWNGAIPAAGSVTLTITATILAGVQGTISNQGTIFYDGNGDHTNDTTRPTDDPVVSGPSDPTLFRVSSAVVEIPALSQVGLLALGLALLLAGVSLLRRQRAVR